MTLTGTEEGDERTETAGVVPWLSTIRATRRTAARAYGGREAAYGR